MRLLLSRSEQAINLIQAQTMEIWEKLEAIKDDYFSVRQQLQSIAKTLSDPVFVIDESGKYLEVHGSQKQSLYYSGKFLVGKNIRNILPKDIADRFMQTIAAAIADNSLKTLEYQLAPGDIAGAGQDVPQRRNWFEGRIYPIKDKAGEVHSVVALAVNITERKHLERQIRELAEKDELTGACTRRYFMRIFNKEFSIAKRYKAQLSVLLILIDNVKEIDDTYGSGGSVAVLKGFVAFCEKNMRRADLLAHHAGEVFIAMLPNTSSLGAAIIAERLKTDAEKMPVAHGKQTVRFTISIGISSIMDSDTNSSAVLSRVEAALYLARKKGSNTIESN